jgi:Matrixin/Putative peptidoglycan binding domain/Clostridial hydrophobic W
MMKRYALSARDIERDSRGEDVLKVQQYLARYGYLQAGHEPSRLDEPTSDALRRFQDRMGLPPSGVVDPETATILEAPRCGVPDIALVDRAVSAVPPAFTLRRCDYEADFRTLTYAFVQGTGDLGTSAEQQAVRNAFETWQNEISIDFQEVGHQNYPNFRIGWFSADHGDGAPFDGVGNTLAHAFYPPPCGGPNAGRLHFDDAETWALSHGAGTFDTETVALHEIGHLLGLAHSAVPGSVMFPTYGGARRALAQDDINGIRAVYGRRGVELEVLVHLEGLGDRTCRENELAGTRGQSRRLEGFQVTADPPVPGVTLRYMAHLQNIGDVPFVAEGKFVGTRGESRRLEGFAIELHGPEAANYDVFYMAHLQDVGDTGFFQNGQFCGTRGESRRVESILVRVEPR